MRPRQFKPAQAWFDRDQGALPRRVLCWPRTTTKEGVMLRLAAILFSIIATTLAGTAVIAALSAGYDTLAPILIAAAAGLLAAFPVTWLVARAIYAES
jgi:hypothetical protein